MRKLKEHNNGPETLIASVWRFDRRISLAFVMTLVLQFAGILIWATQLDARVTRVEQQSADNIGLAERFARVEERLDNVKQDTNAMKQLLSNLTEKLIRQ